MRRPLRIMLGALTVVSLLLSLALAALWVRWEVATGDRLIVHAHAFQLTATAVDGDADLWCLTGTSSSSGWALKGVSKDEAARLVQPASFLQRQFAGVRWIVYPPDAGPRAYWARVPLPALTAAFATIGLTAHVVRGRRSPGAGSGHCPGLPAAPSGENRLRFR